MIWYHDMMVKGCGKVMQKDQHEVNGCEWVVMYEQRDVMEEWILEGEMMKLYHVHDE